MPKIVKKCQYCGESYEVFPCFAKTTKYCSRLCHNRSNAKKLSKRKGKAHHNFGKKWRLAEWPKIVCHFCSKEFECEINQFKNGRKFCSRKCANQKQIKGTKNSKKWWRKESEKLFGRACEKCLSNKKIEVHHIDRHRENNPHDGSNWMRLCVDCHKLIHRLTLERAPIITRKEFIFSS